MMRSPQHGEKGQGHDGHSKNGHKDGGRGCHAGGHEHHAHMLADFKRRFWISLALTVPILVLAPMIQEALGLREPLRFRGDSYLQALFSTIVFFYGGWPFLSGLFDELRRREPGMMTLIGLAVTVAYSYSIVVVIGLPGEVFFWELATLIDVMLLGHWIEMRSVMGASTALEKLAKLMPSQAHLLQEDGSTKDVPASDLAEGEGCS